MMSSVFSISKGNLWVTILLVLTLFSGSCVDKSMGFSARKAQSTARPTAGSVVFRSPSCLFSTVVDNPTETKEIQVIKEDVVEDEKQNGGNGWEIQLYNDPFNHRTFVAKCLCQICGKSDSESYQIMMQAHRNGWVQKERVVKILWSYRSKRLVSKPVCVMLDESNEFFNRTIRLLCANLCVSIVPKNGSRRTLSLRNCWTILQFTTRRRSDGANGWSWWRIDHQAKHYLSFRGKKLKHDEIWVTVAPCQQSRQGKTINFARDPALRIYVQRNRQRWMQFAVLNLVLLLLLMYTILILEHITSYFQQGLPTW